MAANFKKQIQKLNVARSSILSDKQSQNVTNPVPIKSKVSRGEFQYKQGSFSQFAVENEAKTFQTRQLIEKIIKQAIASHLQQIQIVKNSQANIQKLKQKSMNQLSIFLGQVDKNDMNKVFENPVNFFLEKEEYTSFKLYCTRFIAMVIRLAEFVSIDSSFIHIRHINTMQPIVHEQKVLLPLKSDQKVYLKLDKMGNKIVYEIANAYKNKFQMMYMTEQEKQTILEMVVKYLEENSIIYEKNKVQSILESIILQNLKQ